MSTNLQYFVRACDWPFDAGQPHHFLGPYDDPKKARLARDTIRQDGGYALVEHSTVALRAEVLAWTVSLTARRGVTAAELLQPDVTSSASRQHYIDTGLYLYKGDSLSPDHDNEDDFTPPAVSVHHHEDWQLQDHPDGGKYCAACGARVSTNPNGV